jgi:hypothetical protein
VPAAPLVPFIAGVGGAALGAPPVPTTLPVPGAPPLLHAPLASSAAITASERSGGMSPL